MRISHQPCAVSSQLRSQIAAIESSQPELIRFNGRVGPPDHLKFQVGNNIFDRYRRVLKKELVALTAGLFAPEECKDYRAFWEFLVSCQGSRKLQDGNAA